jgi:hypothetical protein
MFVTTYICRSEPRRSQRSSTRTYSNRAFQTRLRSNSDSSLDLAALLFELDLVSAALDQDSSSPQVSQHDIAPLKETVVETLANRQTQLDQLQKRMDNVFNVEPPLNKGTFTPPPAGPANDVVNTEFSSFVDAMTSATEKVASRKSKRIVLRSGRNNLNGASLQYSIDSDFEIEEDSDEETSSIKGTVDFVSSNADMLSPDRVDLLQAPSILQPDEPATNDRERENRVASEAATHRKYRSSRLARLTQRAEEETELNRAILMSIQESQIRPAVTADGAQMDESSQPDEGQISMLINMGFSRDQSIQALRESRMNVELAANRLLGTDF